MTQTDAGFSLYKPGQPGQLVPFAALVKQVPPPFDKEFAGGQGQVIHDKFIVIDFNDANPVVFTGSSNLAEGGETQNGDNLLAIYDPQNMRNVQRLLFADGPSAVTTIPAGVSDSSGGTPAPAKSKGKKQASSTAATTAPSTAATTAAAKSTAGKKKGTKTATKSKAKPTKKKAAPKKKTAAQKKAAPRKTAAKKKPARAAKKAKPKIAAKTRRPAKKASKRKRR